MAGRGGQRCEDAAARTLVEVRRERPSAPASGRPPAPPRQRFPGLLDGAGRGPAPLQSSRRYWSAGSALSPCGPIRARHEKRPIGRPRVSVPLGGGGSRGCEIRARPSRASLGGHLYSGQGGGLRPRRRPGFGGHVSFGQGLRLGPQFPLPRFRPTAVETAALGGKAPRVNEVSARCRGRGSQGGRREPRALASAAPLQPPGARSQGAALGLSPGGPGVFISQLSELGSGTVVSMRTKMSIN